MKKPLFKLAAVTVLTMLGLGSPSFMRPLPRPFWMKMALKLSKEKYQFGPSTCRALQQRQN